MLVNVAPGDHPIPVPIVADMKNHVSSANSTLIIPQMLSLCYQVQSRLYLIEICMQIHLIPLIGLFARLSNSSLRAEGKTDKYVKYSSFMGMTFK